MKMLKPDPFWDGSAGGGVRCSSTGDDAKRYHDPSEHTFEKNEGRSVASLLPRSLGLSGVVIPRATTFGGSRGFDPNKPRLVNIDPDIKGQSCVVDLSKITKEDMEAAFMDAASNPLAQEDIRLLAAQTFHNLSISDEPVGMGNSSLPLQERVAPISGAYVVPKATSGGGQESNRQPMLPVRKVERREMISPSVTPRENVGLTDAVKKRLPQLEAEAQTRMRKEEDEYQIKPAAEFELEKSAGFVDQTEQMPFKPTQPKVKQPNIAMTAITEPNLKVTFELEGYGELEAMYHAVIKSDCLLVLTYDTRYKGTKFFPSASDKLIAVKVEGNKNIMFCHSHGTKFKHAGFEYCLLVIDQEADEEQ